MAEVGDTGSEEELIWTKLRPVEVANLLDDRRRLVFDELLWEHLVEDVFAGGGHCVSFSSLGVEWKKMRRD